MKEKVDKKQGDKSQQTGQFYKIPDQMNNNSSLGKHCFNCAKHIDQTNPKHPIEKHDYPMCNEKTDIVSVEKHFLCLRCLSAFNSVRNFVKKHNLKAFSKEFKLEKVIESSFMKMAHFDPSFTKQNKRQSQIFDSVSKENPNEQSQSSHSFAPGIQLNLNLPNDIYSAIINDTIESENLHHVYWLPKSLQYLIYLTTPERMRPEQRRQRVKKTLQALSYIYCIDESQLKYLAILTQTLFCYMGQEAMLKIIDRLLKGFLQNSVSLEYFLIEQDQEQEFMPDRVFEQRHLHQKPIEYRPDCILETIFSLFILFDFFKDAKLQRHFSEVVHLSHEQLDRISQNSNQQNCSHLAKTFEAYLKKSISDRSKLTKLTEASWQQLVEGKKQKNHLNLIINTMKKEQEENEQLIKEMETKYRKEKDEYINKIVKLNNHISELQSELKNIKENGSLMVRKNSNLIKLKEEDEEVKSNPEMKIVDLKEPKNEPITERTEVPVSQVPVSQGQKSEIKKHKSQVQVQKEGEDSQEDPTMNYLRSILQITDLINFNSKANKKSKKESASFPLPELPNTIKELSQIIIAEISSLVKKSSSLIQENKKLKEESTRLLAILKRKEESWLPLLHEKDEIISLYEKALLCMEKGFILAEEPLSSRIQTIVQNVTKVNFKKLSAENDDDSLRDSASVRSSMVEDIPSNLEVPIKSEDKSEKKTPAKKTKQSRTSVTSSNQKGSDNKIKKKVKKEKEKGDQCLIY